MKALYLLLLLLASCSSYQKNFHPVGPRTQVFPNGTYQHEIRLVQKEAGNQNFFGIVSIKEDTITVMGLSSFSTTVFKMTENRKTKEIKTEIYVDALKKYEDKFQTFYKVVRELLLLKEGTKETVKMVVEGKTIELSLSNYDENKVPQNLEIHHPNFDVFVKVVGYNV